jgi:heme a synthase
VDGGECVCDLDLDAALDLAPAESRPADERARLAVEPRPEPEAFAAPVLQLDRETRFALWPRGRAAEPVGDPRVLPQRVVRVEVLGPDALGAQALGLEALGCSGDGRDASLEPVSVESRAAPRARRLELTPALFAKVALWSAVSLYVIIVSGATVRLTGSGLGCEGWPGCGQGRLFPEKDHHQAVEFGNRVVAIFPLTLSVLAWLAAWRLPSAPTWLRRLAFGVATATIFQAPMGLITIRLDLDPVAVLAHFVLAILALGGAVVVAIEGRALERGREEPVVPGWVRQGGLALAAVCFVLVVTGTLVTAAGPHAGDPDVVDRLWRLTEAMWVHVRASAAFGIGFLALLVLLWRLRPATDRLLRIAAALLALLLAQMAVGEIQYRNELPWWLVLVHVSLAAAIWAATVALVTVLWRPPRLKP